MYFSVYLALLCLWPSLAVVETHAIEGVVVKDSSEGVYVCSLKKKTFQARMTQPNSVHVSVINNPQFSWSSELVSRSANRKMFRTLDNTRSSGEEWMFGKYSNQWYIAFPSRVLILDLIISADGREIGLVDAKSRIKRATIKSPTPFAFTQSVGRPMTSLLYSFICQEDDITMSIILIDFCFLDAFRMLSLSDEPIGTLPSPPVETAKSAPMTNRLGDSSIAMLGRDLRDLFTRISMTDDTSAEHSAKSLSTFDVETSIPISSDSRVREWLTSASSDFFRSPDSPDTD